MPRGDKSKYTGQQERKADHIAKCYESRGVPEKEVERRAMSENYLLCRLRSHRNATAALHEYFGYPYCRGRTVSRHSSGSDRQRDCHDCRMWQTARRLRSHRFSNVRVRLLLLFRDRSQTAGRPGPPAHPAARGVSAALKRLADSTGYEPIRLSRFKKPPRCFYKKPSALGRMDIHLSANKEPARWILAAKLSSVFS
jgi:hypothetical protein